MDCYASVVFVHQYFRTDSTFRWFRFSNMFLVTSTIFWLNAPEIRLKEMSFTLIVITAWAFRYDVTAPEAWVWKWHISIVFMFHFVCETAHSLAAGMRRCWRDSRELLCLQVKWISPPSMMSRELMLWWTQFKVLCVYEFRVLYDTTSSLLVVTS